MKYNFVKIQPSSHYCGINIGETYTSISKKLFDLMGMPKTVSISFDAENRAICLIPHISEHGDFIVKKTSKTNTIKTGTLKRKVGTGRFTLDTEASDEESFILVAHPQTNYQQ